MKCIFTTFFTRGHFRASICLCNVHIFFCILSVTACMLLCAWMVRAHVYVVHVEASGHCGMSSLHYLPLNLKLRDSASLAGPPASGMHLFATPTPKAGVTSTCACPAFYMASGNRNSYPGACTANTKLIFPAPTCKALHTQVPFMLMQIQHPSSRMCSHSS